MALQGTITKVQSVGFCFASSRADLSQPQIITHTWPLIRLRINRMTWKTFEDAIGKPATCDQGLVRCYLGDGVWFEADMPDGGRTEAISVNVTDAPRPRSNGKELRWYNGRWEKYLKTRGWTPA